MMIEFCARCSAEEISAYLDGELEQESVMVLEDHVQSCTYCRQRLDSLSRVVHSLRSMERVAPPPVLDEMVLGRLEVGSVRSLAQRLDGLLESPPRRRSSIGGLFAVVMMLALWMLFFAQAQVLHENRPQVISLPPGVGAEFGLDPDPFQPREMRTIEGRRFLRFELDTPGLPEGVRAYLDRHAAPAAWIEFEGYGSDLDTDDLARLVTCSSSWSVVAQAPGSFVRDQGRSELGTRGRSAAVDPGEVYVLRAGEGELCPDPE